MDEPKQELELDLQQVEWAKEAPGFGDSLLVAPPEIVEAFNNGRIRMQCVIQPDELHFQLFRLTTRAWPPNIELILRRIFSTAPEFIPEFDSYYAKAGRPSLTTPEKFAEAKGMALKHHLEQE